MDTSASSPGEIRSVGAFTISRFPAGVDVVTWGIRQLPCDHVDDGATGHTRIPCRIEITTSRDGPDVGPCNPTIDVTTDARLSMVTRGVITSWIAEDVNGRSIDGPILGTGKTGHVPEHLAVRAYWLARDQSWYEREVTGWALTVESARVVVSDRWSVEYAPSVGDR
jgi:hypothetical protein